MSSISRNTDGARCVIAACGLAMLAAGPVAAQDRAVAPCRTDTLTTGFPAHWLGTRVGQVTVNAATVAAPDGTLGAVVRALHSTTRLRIPLNDLTFASGDVMDSLEVQESARRLRRTGLYVDVFVTGTTCGTGTTDFTIFTRDAWSLRLDVRYGRATSKVSLSEVNLGGYARSLAVIGENADDRDALTVAYVDPYLFNTRARGGVLLRNFADGRAWQWTLRSRDFSPRDNWRFTLSSYQLRRTQLDLSKPVALNIERRTDAVTVQRKVAQDRFGVLAWIVGLEHEKADLDVVRVGASLGNPEVRREFTAPLVGLARRSMQVAGIDWLVRGQLPTEVPRGFETEVVVGVGKERISRSPITHVDAWVGHTAEPTAGTVLTGDAWLSGYFLKDSVMDGVARFNGALYQRTGSGSWALRVSAERVVHPDPDVFTLSIVDPTLRALMPSSRLAESALSVTLERAWNVYAREGRWGADVVPFVQYTERHNSVSGNDTLSTNPEVLLLGLGLRRVFALPTQPPIRFDIARTVWRRGGGQNRWVFAFSTQPWFNPNRRRDGQRDVAAR